MPLITDSRAPGSRQAPGPDVESRLPVASRPRASRQVRLLAALACLAASVTAAPVNAPAQTDPAGPCSEASLGFLVLSALRDAGRLNNPALVQDCKALVAIRDHLVSSPAIAERVQSWWPEDNPWKPVRQLDNPLFEQDDPNEWRVTNFSFGFEGYTGEIPAELGNLTGLKYLYIPEHEFQFTGEIPAELGKLTNLTSLDLSGHQLTGPIPAELGNLTNLTSLDLRDNQLTGPIPAELGKLTNLQRLGLASNQLTGEIPAELGNLTNLPWLSLYGNQLTGEIPAELGNLTNLTSLDLRDNQLTGPIPAELGNLTNLTELDLRDNQLTGPIPAELGNLTNLTSLDLRDNQLTGPIPAELGKLTNLTELDLRDNQLTGPIPAELGDLTNLTNLILYGNQLTGEIPAELGKLTNLTWLGLFGNQLTGEIPAELGKLTNLTELALGRNQLTGPIPAELGKLTNLTGLILTDNRLTGEIPAELCKLTNLMRLGLASNQLTGEVPKRALLDKASISEFFEFCPSTRFEGRFSDDEGSVHEDSIEQIAQWGITTGCEENRFCPSRTVNRAQMAAFLYRAVTHLHGGTAPGQGVGARLSDVAGDAWYRTNALWAVNNGVIRAPGGRFDPGGAVTRADMAEMLIAAFDHLTAPARAQGLFSDTAGFSDAVVRAMEGIRAAGVTTGCATNPLRYCPGKTVTRAQMASFLSRAVQALGQ